MMTVGTMGRPYKAIYLMHWEIETTISDNPGPILHNLDDIANFHNRDPETQLLLPGLGLTALYNLASNDTAWPY